MAKKKLYQVWVDKLDGRTNKWLHDRTKIAQSELSRILTGKLQPTDEQTKKINAVLNKVVTL